MAEAACDDVAGTPSQWFLLRSPDDIGNVGAVTLVMWPCYRHTVILSCMESSFKVCADMSLLLCKLWSDDRGQDIAEYAVMLAVILVIVVGTIQLIGSNANNVFSQVASGMQ